MSLLVFQNFLLRLCTDTKLQNSFFANPQQILSSYPLTEKERNALLYIPRREILIFSRHRFDQRKKLLQRKIESNPDAVIVSSFYETGPIILYQEGGSVKMNKLTDEQFNIMRVVRRKIYSKAIIFAYLASDDSNLKALFNLILLFSKNRLWNKDVIALW